MVRSVSPYSAWRRVIWVIRTADTHYNLYDLLEVGACSTVVDGTIKQNVGGGDGPAFCRGGVAAVHDQRGRRRRHTSGPSSLRGRRHVTHLDEELKSRDLPRQPTPTASAPSSSTCASGAALHVLLPLRPAEPTHSMATPSPPSWGATDTETPPIPQHVHARRGSRIASQHIWSDSCGSSPLPRLACHSAPHDEWHRPVVVRSRSMTIRRQRDVSDVRDVVGEPSGHQLLRRSARRRRAASASAFSSRSTTRLSSAPLVERTDSLLRGQLTALGMAAAACRAACAPLCRVRSRRSQSPVPGLPRSDRAAQSRRRGSAATASAAPMRPRQRGRGRARSPSPASEAPSATKSVSMDATPLLHE